MFDEPEERPVDRILKPSDRAREKSDEFRVHAELCAVFEGPRKFDARIIPKLDPEIARDVQRTMARLERARPADNPILPEASIADALRILTLADSQEISTNDYHIYRRPGEVMAARWLEGEQVDFFYTRLQAHFDAALTQHREDERTTHGWKQDPQTLDYLTALDGIKIEMADRYLRQLIRTHQIFVLSTQTADELDILHLTDAIMGVPASEIVGSASAPPDEPTERDRAWFMKLFSLRGMHEGRERMCFFTYLQKSDDSFE